jgi:hypothetical protein
MKFIYPAVGIILTFVWCVLLLNWQLDDIRSLKSQLAVCQDFERDVNQSNSEIASCIADVEFLKAGLEDVIYASEHGLK